MVRDLIGYYISVLQDLQMLYKIKGIGTLYLINNGYKHRLENVLNGVLPVF